MLQRLKQEDSGFTLIELLVAMMVSGIILAAIATGFIATARGSSGVHERLLQSHDAQLLATYFTSDVQSANPAMVNFDPATPTGCAGSSPGTNVLRLQWTEVTGGTTTAFSASYRIDSAAGQWKLYRHFCTGTGTTDPATILAAAPGEVSTVAHDLRDPSEKAPEVVQSGVKLTLTLHSALVSGQNPYSFSFTAAMRTPVTASLAFLVSAGPSQTAGAPFDVTVKASTDGSTVDTSYSGTKTLSFSGPSTSPSGATPTYPASVTFANGEATFPVTLVRSGTPTLAISQGLYAGSVALTVAPSTATLTLAPCPPTTKISTPTAMTVGRGVDAYGNTASTGSDLVVNLGATAGTLPPTVTIPAAASSATFNYTTPPAAGTNVTLSATAAGYNAATCGPFTTTNASPVFLVAVPATATAGTEFDVTIKASSNGTDVDTSYVGAKSVAFSGASDAPNGQVPIFPSLVTFSAGEATVPVTLFKAGATTLTVTEGTRTGTAPTAVTVASAPLALSITDCATLSEARGATNAIKVSGADAYGNGPASNLSVTISASNGNPSSSTLQIDAGSTVSSSSVNVTNHNGNGKLVTLTPSAPGHTGTACSFTTS